MNLTVLEANNSPGRAFLVDVPRDCGAPSGPFSATELQGLQCTSMYIKPVYLKQGCCEWERDNRILSFISVYTIISKNFKPG